MPTGYTAKLESINYNLEKWLTEDIPRAMGMCVMLRDDTRDMTIGEIREGIKSDSAKYYEESIERGLTEIDTLEKMTEQQWKDNLAKTIQEDKDRVAERKTEWSFKKEKHLESVNKVNNLISKAKDKTIKDILGFAKQQLDMVIDSEYNSESEPKVTDCVSYSSWKNYKKLRLDMAYRSVEYDRKRITENNEKTKERLAAFDTYTKFVQKLKDTL